MIHNGDVSLSSIVCCSDWGSTILPLSIMSACSRISGTSRQTTPVASAGIIFSRLSLAHPVIKSTNNAIDKHFIHLMIMIFEID